MSHSLLVRAFVTTAGMGIQGVARFVYTLAIGRVMGPEPLGEVSAILSLAVYFSLLWPAGTGIGASRFLPLEHRANAYLSSLKRSFFVGALLLSIAAFPLALWMTGDLIASLLSCALVFTYSAYVFVRGALLGGDRYIRATVLDTVSSFIAITALAVVLLGHVDAVLLAPLALGYGVFAVVGWPRGETSSLTGTERAGLSKFIRHATLGTLATGGLLPATMVFVQGFDTSHAAGLFAAGLSLATPANLLAQALAQVLVPHFARVHHQDPGATATDFRRVFAWSSAGFVVIFAVLIALAEPLLLLTYGPVYRGGTFATQALLAVVFVISCSAVPTALLQATGREFVNSRVWLAAFALGTVAMAILAPLWGVPGALTGFAVGGVVGSLGVVVAGFMSPREKSVASYPPSRPV